MNSDAVVRTKSRSLTKNYGEKWAKSGRSNNMFSNLSGRQELAGSGPNKATDTTLSAGVSHTLRRWNSPALITTENWREECDGN